MIITYDCYKDQKSPMSFNFGNFGQLPSSFYGLLLLRVVVRLYFISMEQMALMATFYKKKKNNNNTYKNKPRYPE